MRSEPEVWRLRRAERSEALSEPVNSVAEAAALCQRVLAGVGRAVVGKEVALQLVLAGVLAGGHVLIEDNPGLGKTLLARSLAQALGLEFRRVQFTPDLLPGDITGSFVYDRRRREFEFRPGPLFAGLVLADEVNRTPPKTQSALLEAMQEGQATVEGQTFALPTPFHVIATPNPIEYEGTYALPEAQLDRFLLRVSMGYPNPAEELEVLNRRVQRRHESVDVAEVTDAAGLAAAQRVVETVAVEQSVAQYCVSLAAATREHRQLLVGASPRGALALMLVSRALAVLDARDYVTPDGVKRVAVAALSHRVTLQPEVWMRGVAAAQVIREVLDTVPAPAAEDARHAAAQDVGRPDRPPP